MIYHIFDIFFVVFHTSLVLFNLTGWIWRRTRRINFITLLLTGASWSLLGLIVGIPGYCPLTVWHFDILEKLGKTDLPYSYMKYLSDRLTGLNISPDLVDSVTLYTFLAALLISVLLNSRDLIRKRKQRVT
ncbi:MAG: DUF2784 domain-containing protein [Bacteroidales bacterium]|nr:DUF2784 domain-containing protein [Bacteroidales bacterium]